MQEATVTALRAAIYMCPADLKILTFLGTLGPLTAARLAEALDVNTTYVAQRVLILLERGLIERTDVAIRPSASVVRPGYRITDNFQTNLAALAEGFDTSVIDAMTAR
jgi:DNA-binding Lrp family transcriptional regulator